ncbi:TonB-dependent receptor [Sphingopyxis sp.]|uniref:TonB-dependent receptor n=1 Tax=Sphingopyxis sp. TaxID=1908224 RepID=UPI002ED7EBE3
MPRNNQSALKRAYLLSAATAALMPVTPALALEGSASPEIKEAAAESGETAPQEILVTARRRSESLQQVPIAVTVLTSEDIQRSGIESVADFANLTPNVTFDNALNLGTNILTIRGQTQAQYGPPPAAIVVDGVLQMSPLQFNVDEFDLSQVEVLKGPQGAIYGRNAIAGAINMTTSKPGDAFKARAFGSFARGNEWKGKASVSGPIVPGLLYALGGISYTDRRGQVRNITTGTYSDKLRDFTGRLRLVATPTDNLEADIKYTYSDAKGHDPAYVTSRSRDPAQGNDPFDSNRVGTNPRTLHDLSGRLNWEAGFATVTATLAYIDVKESLTEDLDYKPIDFLRAEQDERQKGFSQELRIASPSSGSLRWLVGAYHVRLKAFRGATIYFDPFYFGLAPEPTSADTLIGASADNSTDETWSGFGQVQYDITPELSLEANLRYDSDRIRQQAVGSPIVQRIKFSKWQPKGTLTYRPSQDFTLYGSIGEGFRSGTFNATDASFGDPIVRPEKATTYEVGVKTRLLDRRLTLNAAIYQTDLTDGQFTLFDAAGATNVRINIDKTRIRGFEIESALRLLEGFAVNASFGYTDPKVKSFLPPAGYPGAVASYIGNRPPRVAKITANFGLDFEIPASETLRLFVRPEYRYIGAYFWNLENNYKRPAYNLVNFRAGVRDADDRWALTGFVRNALNEKITSEYQPFVNSGLPTGEDAYYPPVGAIYGIEATYRF